MGKPAIEIYGIVLCGGKSSRMGSDKSMLVYHDNPQRYHVYEMLEGICNKVYISCNASQEVEPGYDFIKDNEDYSAIGPLAGLLTAFDNFPGKNILLVGCDYPFIKENELRDMLSTGKDVHAVAFYNKEAICYEPLLAFYSYDCRDILMDRFSKGDHSLQHFLEDSQALKYYPADKRSIISIDTKNELNNLKETIEAS